MLLSRSLLTHLLFLIIFSNASFSKELDSEDSHQKGFTTHHRPTANFMKGQKKFTEEEHALIDGKKLSLHGILLFRSYDPAGDLITRKTNSNISHCGIDILVHETGEHLCFESTGSAQAILIDFIPPQVQIHRLDEVIAGYKGDVWRRTLQYKDGFESKASDVSDFINLYLGRPYTDNFEGIEELFHALDRSNTQDTPDRLFCSELAALILRDLEYLPKETLPNNCLPCDFSQDLENLSLINVKLGDQIQLKDYAAGEGIGSNQRRQNQRGCCALL